MFSSFVGFVLCSCIVLGTYFLSFFICSNHSLPELFLGSFKGCLLFTVFLNTDANVVGQGLEGLVGSVRRRGVCTLCDVVRCQRRFQTFCLVAFYVYVYLFFIVSLLM
jgi:hypothetical protein